MPRDVQVSKALSKLLRHSAEKEGLKLDEAGYINLKDVVGFFEGIYFPFLDPSICSLVQSLHQLFIMAVWDLGLTLDR